MTIGQVKNLHATVRFGYWRVVLPTQANVEGEVARRFPLVLNVGQNKGPAQSMAIPGTGVVNERQRVVDEGGVVIRSWRHDRGSREPAEGDRQGLSLALIETDPHHVNSKFHGMATVGPGGVVGIREGGPNLIVGLVVVQGLVIWARQTDIDQTRINGIVERSAVDSELELVEEGASRLSLQRKNIVCGIIVGADLIEQISGCGGRVCDVALARA